MHTKTLHQAMPIVATALARKFGVAVIVGGTQAQTDGRTIWLPDLPATSHLRPVAWGFLAHEASHVRHTDMAVFQTAGAASPLRQHLLNILEDIRIERAIRHQYPGTRATLERVIDWMLAEGQLKVPEVDAHPARILTGFLLLSLRARALGQTALIPHATAAEQVLRQTFPASLVHRLLGLMSRIGALTSTAQAAALAVQIEGLLEEEAKTPPTHQASDGDSGQSDEANDEEAGQGGPGVDPETVETDAETAADTSAADGGTNGDGASEQYDAEHPVDQVRQALAATADDLDGDLFEAVRQQLAELTAEGSSPLLLPAAEEANADALRGRIRLAEVQETSRTLITRLKGLVQASRLDRPLPVHQGRKLIPNRLHRAGVGEGRLFARKTARTTPNTAVHLLVDLSGSMSRQVTTSMRAYQVALEAGLALALALDRIPGVSVAVTAFPGESGDEATVTRLLQHGQRPAARAGAFAQSPRGSTPLAQGMWFAAADLLLRPEPRCLILTLTDGEPDDPALALSVIAQCEQAGLELSGLGIQHDVSLLFRHSRVIEAVDDLKQALFGLAERLLV
ncbi:VWA domain-containing protein [Thiorhodococcus mannitoliphagus]|uniref:VWA domain-containing protein n=1 Tax=Thiorhodococcus mannitoliphagus TaxID=329406 RepID=A0A6P1DXU3_9GAMM|nr:VWA domain-containing protein [Thiorhodococcus mannitoliphagus]NEX21801.1 VWA domain-containing protein [Thiorhodococcus mannitoliphagus]